MPLIFKRSQEDDLELFIDILTEKLKNQEEEEPKLPLTEHECEKCGHAQAYYYNRQMRSADEGETTFYICQKCDHQTSTNN